MLNPSSGESFKGHLWERGVERVSERGKEMRTENKGWDEGLERERLRRGQGS